MGILRCGGGRCSETVLTKLLLVYISANDHRRFAAAENKRGICVRDKSTIVWFNAVCHRIGSCCKHCDVSECGAQGIPRQVTFSYYILLQFVHVWCELRIFCYFQVALALKFYLICSYSILCESDEKIKWKLWFFNNTIYLKWLREAWLLCW